MIFTVNVKTKWLPILKIKLLDHELKRLSKAADRACNSIERIKKMGGIIIDVNTKVSGK